MPPRTQVNSATGIMGPTGVGKSSLAYTLALYLWQTYRKVLLYYSSDGGGFPALVQKGQALGIIRVFRMATRDPGTGELSEETCYRSAQGWWPRRINPATGEVPPGVEMVPPYTMQFAMSCPQGHLIKTVPSQAMLIPTMCPQCKRMVNKVDYPMQVVRANVQNKGFEDVGGVFYDGLTSMLAWIMRDLGHRAGRMELKGEEGAIGGKVTSGDLKFGGSTRSHVGFAQARGEELVHLTLGIHGLMVPPVFTMLTHEDVDDRSLSIRGPKIAGRAKTDEAPQWFGNMLEAAKIPAPNSAGEQRVLYLSEFTDALNVRHLCKHRGAPGTMPNILSDPPEDPTHPELAFTQFNLGVFFSMLNQALEQEIERGKQEIPDAPGLPEGMVEYGDNSVQLPAAPLAAAPTQPVQNAGPVTVPAVAATPLTSGVAGAPAAPTVRAPRTRKPPVQAALPIQPDVPVEMPAAALPAPVGQEAVAAPAGLPAPGAATAPEPMLTQSVPTTPPVVAAPAPPVVAAPRAAAAPPPGRRPGSPATLARPATPVAGAAGNGVAASGMPAPGTPAGASVRGPAAPRPTVAAPRAPAAAPRPPSTAVTRTS